MGALQKGFTALLCACSHGDSGVAQWLVSRAGSCVSTERSNVGVLRTLQLATRRVLVAEVPPLCMLCSQGAQRCCSLVRRASSTLSSGLLRRAAPTPARSATTCVCTVPGLSGHCQRLCRAPLTLWVYVADAAWHHGSAMGKPERPSGCCEVSGREGRLEPPD
jgi:hypothetical protein